MLRWLRGWREDERRRLAREAEHRERSYAEQRRANRIAMMAIAVALGIGAITAMVTVAVSGWPDQGDGTGATATPPRPVPPGAAPAPPLGRTVDLGCPAPPEAPGPPALTLRVVAWCATATGPRRQAEVKIKLRVKNVSRRRQDIRVRRWWLLVTKFNPRRWSPPQYGPKTTARPCRVQYQGRLVWAVPANADGAFDDHPKYKGEYTFATHWDGAMLAPGAVYFRRVVKKGDLIFYVPLRGRRREIPGLLGVAYLDARRRVRAVAPYEEWGDRLPANEF